MVPAECSQGFGKRSRLVAAIVGVLLLLSGMGLAPQPAGAVAAGTVTIRLHSCPDGFDGINATLSQLVLTCVTPMGGIDFTVQYAGLAPSHQTDLDGSWQFTGVSSGTVTITEGKPDPSLLIRATCSQFDVSTGVNNYQEAPVGQSSATWNLQDGQAIDCDWYNFPVAAPAPTATAATAATVVVRAHDCPDGFDASSASFNDLAANCQGTPSGLTYTLTASSGPPRGGATDATGFITWQGIALGQITIAEVPADNHDSFRVFCNQRTDSGGELGFSEEPVSSSTSITDTIQDGYSEYDCDWFNARSQSAPAATETPTEPSAPTAIPITNSPATQTPIPPTGAITIEGFACPAGYDLFAKNADPKTDCADAAANVAFTLSGGSAPVKHKTGANGAIAFKNLKAGDYQLVETMPSGVHAAFIGSCDSSARDLSAYSFTPFARIGDDGKLGVNLQDGEKLDCRWYDVPSASATVTITVKDCPGQSVVLSQCAAATSGVQFSLTPSGSGAAATLTTDATGIATANVPAGTYQLKEVGANWCLADSSAFDQNANLVVKTAAVQVAIYRCS